MEKFSTIFQKAVCICHKYFNYFAIHVLQKKGVKHGILGYKQMTALLYKYIYLETKAIKNKTKKMQK